MAERSQQHCGSTGGRGISFRSWLCHPHRGNARQRSARGLVKTSKPIVVDLHNLAMAARPVHPNAAKLWIDFLLSNEGQRFFSNIKKPYFEPV